MKISSPVGVKGEDLAVDYLRKKGYRIIERNFRKGYGEIDIIALENKVLVFVEVKTRTTDLYGTPFEQISSSKLRSLVKTAEFYRHTNSNLPDQIRIDAIGVMLDSNGNAKDIDHIENIT